MKLAPYKPALPVALGLTTLFVLAGCTLSGSGGIGDVTPAGNDGGAIVDVTSAATPIVIAPTETPTISELDRLSTQTALNATAQAQATVDTGGSDDTATAIATPVPVVTSDLGGEFALPTNTPIGTLVADAGTGTTTDASCPPTHTIAQGENLYRIALQFGLSYQELAAANGIANPGQLSVGIVLNIPGCGGSDTAVEPADTAPIIPSNASAYTVQSGDNLYRIALRFNMTWATLAAFNGLPNPNVVIPGQVLQIPQ